jgi:hypothetical protein
MDYRGLIFGIVRVIVSLTIGGGILYIMHVMFKKADKG